MANHPEAHFQKKLDGFKRNPPAQVWEKIELNLDKRKSSYRWINVAAGILIVIAMGIYFLISDQVNVPDAPTVTIYMPQTQLSHPVDSSSADSSIAVIQKDPAPSSKIIQEAQTVKTDLSAKKEFSEVVVTDRNSEDPESIQLEESGDEMVLANEVNPSIEEIKLPELNSRYILISAKDANNKYLQKRIEKPRRKVQVKKDKSSLVELASTIRNSEVGLGDLRQLKDELLTFDFLAQNDKNDKINTQ